MDSRNSKEVEIFAAIAMDAKNSGLRVLGKWVGTPPEALRKTDPEVYELLKDMSASDLDRLMPLVTFALQTSFFYLFKHLEEGQGDTTFHLSMQAESNSESISLIAKDQDLMLREIFL